MKNLLLIDANALIHRAFHALPPLTTPDGQPIGAIYGLASTLLKVLREQPPDYIAACFDRPEPTFRKEMFGDYKAHRPPAAEELISQIIKAHELFEKFGIPIFEKAGYEADDIIGTLVNVFKDEEDLKITILTGDLDTLQLIFNDRIVVQTFKKGVSDITIYNEPAVIKRYGLKPSQLPDYKGLVGDSSDNIPGVKGVGPKTAEKILKEYYSLENFFDQLERKKENPLAKKFLPFRGLALFSKKLTTIEPNVPLEPMIGNIAYRGLPQKELIKYFAKLGFQSLIDRIFKKFTPLEIPALPAGRRPGLGSRRQPPRDDLFLTRQAPKKFIIFSDFNEALKRTNELSSSKKIKIAYDWHELIKKLGRKVEIKEPIFDVKIASWLIDPDQKDFSLEALSRRFLHKEMAGNNKQILGELYLFTERKINEYDLKNVFEKIEMPLIPILVAMEKNGVLVNVTKIRALARDAQKDLKVLTAKIHGAAGVEFNVNSPRQLSDVLFQRLGLKSPRVRKTDTGLRSTSEQTLFELKNQHPIVDFVLEYREIFKIKSTYLDPFQEMVEADSRIRTHFNQTGTATGRLSSERPNLQNIPQESRWAQPIRDAFEALPGSHLVSFDYSQLELRILAQETGDPKLKEAFNQNQDVHRLTASQVFNVPYEKVTPEMRRLGKTLNFGIVYGMGSNALATTSELNRTEAEAFIREYFSDFPNIKEWQERVKAEARTAGFIKNANGRRRWFLKIVSNSLRTQAEAERAATNMPIQGLEADIIKLAMIKTTALIHKKRWGTKIKLILSIHDELLFEVKNDILNQAATILKDAMEKVYSLSVPLKVHVKHGPTWGSLNSFSET
jgi:DNA polymerase-1